MMSSRYVPAICALVAIALVPTLIHSYSGDRVSDGRSAAAVPTVLGDYVSVPSDRNATWGKRRFDSDDWIERNYSNLRRNDEVRVTIVRSFDAKSVYHHPELAVAYGTSFEGEETHYLPGRSNLPLHVLRPAAGTSARAVYVLHYDDRFIDNPIAFQIRTAGELLFSARKPLTLFFALDENADAAQSVEQWPAVSLLLSAVDAFVK
jgi:hypothetical protein